MVLTKRVMRKIFALMLTLFATSVTTWILLSNILGSHLPTSKSKSTAHLKCRVVSIGHYTLHICSWTEGVKVRE